MTARAVIRCLTVAAVAASVSGCGSDTLSAQALRRQAGLVCSTAIRRSDRIAIPNATSAGATFLAEGITVFRPELAALRKLAPPHGLASAYRAALGDSTQQLDALIATDHNLRTGGDPVVAVKQLDVELAAINARDRQAWRSVGVPACANLSAGHAGQGG
jgi:hypothetical protein